MKKRLSGFSLVELMAVVAIITVLAMLAVPNFQRLQQKARQSEAKGLLSAYHSAMSATRAELGCFKGNFVVTGFQPEGELYYRITTADNAICSLPTAIVFLNDPACISTDSACNATGSNYSKNWTERSTTQNGLTAVSVTNSTYRARAAGDIGGNNDDEWTINESKVLSNPFSGL